MESITAWFFRVTSIQLIVVMGVIYLIFPLYLLPNIINSGHVEPLDLLLWYNHDTLYQMMTSYGEEIRRRYMIGLLTVDLAYPIYYGSFLALIIALVLKKLVISYPQKMIFTAYIVVFFDLIENLLLVYLLNSYPNEHFVIADIAGYVTATKWSAFGIIVTLVIFLVIYGIQSRKNRRRMQ